MIIKHETLQALRTMVRGEFAAQMGILQKLTPLHQTVATVVPSNTRSNTYGWLGNFPQLREWVGPRVLQSMKESAYAIVNQKYEATLQVDRVDIEDDNLGIYRPLARSLAKEVVDFFDRKIVELIAGGFTGLCYDGQPFFDAEHPVYPNTDGTGTPVDTSNIVGEVEGTSAPWYLLALSGVLKPFILQQRTQPELEEITDPKNDSVFLQDKYLYGIRYRGSFGYGFWQQAVVCKEPLTAATYQAARLVMQQFKRDGGDPLGMVPTHLPVDPTNEAAGRTVLEMQFDVGGGSNPNYHTATLIVSPWLPGAPPAVAAGGGT
jgi:phage major head subunit gpT-like protein